MSVTVEVPCPRCVQAVPVRSYGADALARCRACDHVFEVASSRIPSPPPTTPADVLGAPEPAAPVEPPPTPAPLPAPVAGGVAAGPAVPLDGPLSASRKTFCGVSIGLGAWSALAFVLSIVTAATLELEDEAELAVFGQVALLVGFVPAIFGVGFGLAAFEKHAKNPGALWAGPLTAGGATCLWILLVVLGAVAG